MPPPEPAPTYSAAEVEVLQRLTRMETKLDGFAETRETAIRAENAAVKAGNCAEENAKDIVELKESQKWQHRTIVVIIAGAALNFVINYLQGI